MAASSFWRGARLALLCGFGSMSACGGNTSGTTSIVTPNHGGVAGSNVEAGAGASSGGASGSSSGGSAVAGASSGGGAASSGGTVAVGGGRTCPPSTENCGPARYCDYNDVCRDDGTCFDHLDCTTPGNDYAINYCAGSVRCVSGKCAQECGASDQCRDLDGIAFGGCEMFLGWGVSGTACTAFSGCSNRGQPFFTSESECRNECGL